MRNMTVLRPVLILALAGAQWVRGGETRLLPLMPTPWKAVVADGRLAVTSTFSVAASGYSDARLESAMRRLVARVARQTGIAISYSKVDAAHATLVIECRERGPEYPSLGEDEAYRLEVSGLGANIKAATVTGALRGLETFAQLIGPGPDGFEAPAIHVDDKPRFPWRGLMLDVSRHWMPIEVVERNLDAMAAVKLNVFHWHLADDQGFRVESKRYPRLQELGSDGHFYTQDDVRRVIAYARERGIRVIPEFDIPGHTTSWFVGYPELASAPGPYQIERTWGIFQPTMDPAREQTYTFLDGFLGEMTALFPDPYFHIGGDEVDDTQWKSSASIQAFAREHKLLTTEDLHGYFNQRVQALLKKYGKTMIGWDETLRPGLSPDTVIQSWRGQASLASAAKSGYRGILSFGYYLDHLMPASFHYAVDPLDGGARELNGEQAARILGGEACMWSEYVSAETVDSRIWPRMAAIAERFWAPRETTDVRSMYARLEAVDRQLEWSGVQSRANYGRMVARMAGGWPVEPLRLLADASESAIIDVRRGARKYSSNIPLNRLVDAVRPESESIRRLERAAENAARGSGAPAELAELRAAFTAWAENNVRLGPLAGNALIEELEPLSKNLSKAGAIGLGALGYLESGSEPPKGWISQQSRILDAMAKPSAEVKLAAVRPVKALLEALAHRKSSGLSR
jgi:hexosaminidase